MVAIGVEVAAGWPVFGIVAAWMLLRYVPDWHTQGAAWLRHHRAGELVTIELVALGVLLVIYLLQRLTRAGLLRHRVRRQWRVAWGHEPLERGDEIGRAHVCNPFTRSSPLPS